MAGRKPDYSIGVLNKSNGRRGNVGGAWLNDDGSGMITIQLNPGTMLSGDNDQLVISLFPADYKPSPKKPRRTDKRVLDGDLYDENEAPDEDKPY